MCGNPFKKPKVETPVVEQVAPAPQAVSPTDTGAAEDRVKAENERARRRRGYAATRAADMTTLAGSATSDKRSTLG